MTLTGFSMNVEETGEKSENQKHFFEEMSKNIRYLLFLDIQNRAGGTFERTSELESLL